MTKRFLFVLIVVGLFAVVAVQPAFARKLPPTPTGLPCKEYTRVKLGDNLMKLSQEYNIDPLTLIRLNGFEDPNLLLPDQKICVGTLAASGKFYAVMGGDTLTWIANTYKSDVYYLAAVNGIKNPDLIYAGQVLFIPKGRRIAIE